MTWQYAVCLTTANPLYTTIPISGLLSVRGIIYSMKTTGLKLTTRNNNQTDAMKRYRTIKKEHPAMALPKNP